VTSVDAATELGQSGLRWPGSTEKMHVLVAAPSLGRMSVTRALGKSYAVRLSSRCLSLSQIRKQRAWN